MCKDWVTCSRCGKIVERGHNCPYKNKMYQKKDTNANKFRNTKAWLKKSIEIRQRDKYLCQVCINNLYNTINCFNTEKLEVHHITPIEEDYNRILDNDNLITLCNTHHRMAELGKIPRNVLYNLINK